MLGLTLTVASVVVAVLAPLLVRFDPFAFAAPPLLPPSVEHPMGTDAIGRDVMSGVLHGARASLLVASGAAALAGLVGTIVGTVSGYAGGIADDLLMRLTELFQTIPRFFLVVVVLALFGPGLDRVVLMLGLTAWPTLARVVRGETLALLDLEFMVAARASGASPMRIMLRHVLPNTLNSVGVLLGLLFGQALLVEASVGFLGLSNPDVMSWGSLARNAQGYTRVAWWLSLFPGLAIASAVLGVNLLADALSAASAAPSTIDNRADAMRSARTLARPGV